MRFTSACAPRLACTGGGTVRLPYLAAALYAAIALLSVQSLCNAPCSSCAVAAAQSSAAHMSRRGPGQWEAARIAKVDRCNCSTQQLNTSDEAGIPSDKRNDGAAPHTAAASAASPQAKQHHRHIAGKEGHSKQIDSEFKMITMQLRVSSPSSRRQLLNPPDTKLSTLHMAPTFAESVNGPSNAAAASSQLLAPMLPVEKSTPAPLATGEFHSNASAASAALL